MFLPKLLPESVRQRKPTADSSSCGGGRSEGWHYRPRGGRKGWCLLPVLESESLTTHPPTPSVSKPRRRERDRHPGKMHIPASCTHTHSLSLSLSLSPHLSCSSLTRMHACTHSLSHSHTHTILLHSPSCSPTHTNSGRSLCLPKPGFSITPLLSGPAKVGVFLEWAIHSMRI